MSKLDKRIQKINYENGGTYFVGEKLLTVASGNRSGASRIIQCFPSVLKWIREGEKIWDAEEYIHLNECRVDDSLRRAQLPIFEDCVSPEIPGNCVKSIQKQMGIKTEVEFQKFFLDFAKLLLLQKDAELSVRLLGGQPNAWIRKIYLQSPTGYIKNDPKKGSLGAEVFQQLMMFGG